MILETVSVRDVDLRVSGTRLEVEWKATGIQGRLHAGVIVPVASSGSHPGSSGRNSHQTWRKLRSFRRPLVAGHVEAMATLAVRATIGRAIQWSARRAVH